MLIGADGQLGRYLRQALAGRGELTCCTRQGRDGDLACDLTDLPALTRVLTDVAPALIVNAAAYTAVDKAEAEPGLAALLNADVVRVIGEWAATAGSAVIHYSTDYVFDGTATRPYRESDTPTPANAYGASKLAGEVALARSAADHLILRTAWVYSRTGRNFLTTMLRLASTMPRLRVVADQIGSPTSAPDIAQITAQIAARWMSGSLQERGALSGVYHLTAQGSTSWHGFAEAIVAQAHAAGLLSLAPPVDAITTAQYPTPATRPAYSVLDTSKLAATFDIQAPTWQRGLHDVLATVTDPS
nr:dTDP-4-dehydrorhamnose reductase [Luteibacter sp. Sphag1AF]